MKKQRHYFANKCTSSQGYGFPVVMYGCERWTIKKAEHRRIDAFELWCWRRLLRVPWASRRSNQSILKEINPGCSLEGLMLELKLQYFDHVMRRADPLEKTLMLGKIEGRRSRGRQRMRWLDGITDLMDMGFWRTPGVGYGQGGLACCSSWGRKESDTTERLNWTEVEYHAHFLKESEYSWNLDNHFPNLLKFFSSSIAFTLIPVFSIYYLFFKD